MTIVTTADRVRPRRPAPIVVVETSLVAIVLATVVTWAIMPGIVTAADPLTGVVTETFLPPSLAHPFGTDHLGRDVLARVIHGTANTLSTAIAAVAIGFGGGTLIGLVGPSSPRVLDPVLMRWTEVLTALPGILVALLIITITGPGLGPIAVGVGIASMPTFARVMRAEVRRVRGLDYVEAAALSGAGPARVLLGTVLPNAFGPVVALVGIDLGASIMAIAGLGFLGYGALPPTPEWGVLIADGRNYLTNAWWLTTLPGTVILVTVLALSIASRRLLERTRR